MKVLEREFKEYDIDEKAWAQGKPHGISGCFRLRDEAQFMVRSIESHLPCLTEAVLVVQDSNDETVQLAEWLKMRHPDKVMVYHYPVIPRFIDHPEWKTTPEDSIYSFVYMSNWALSKCRCTWIAKTEGDVIALSSFKYLTDTVYANPFRRAYYGRVILNVAGQDCDQVSYENVRNGGWDECVVPNHPDYRFYRRDKWEVLVNPSNSPEYCFGWSALHMKRCKREFLPGPWNGESYVPYTPQEVAKACRRYNCSRQQYPGNDGWPEGGPVLFEKVI